MAIPDTPPPGGSEAARTGGTGGVGRLGGESGTSGLPAGEGAVGSAGAANTGTAPGGRAPGGPEGTTGRVSEALSGVAGAASAASSTGEHVDRTTLGTQTSTSGPNTTPGLGGTIGTGTGAAGGLGLHGDPEVGARAGSTGMMGGAAGSGLPGGLTRGGITSGQGGGRGGPGGAGSGVAADNERNLTAGLAGAAGHQEGTESGGPVAARPAGTDNAMTPAAQEGDTTAAIGGSAIDRVTAGRGSDVGGGLAGTG